MSELVERLRLKSGTRQFLITEETAREAADALEGNDNLICDMRDWMRTKAVHHHACHIQSGSDDCTCGLHDLISKANLNQ